MRQLAPHALIVGFLAALAVWISLHFQLATWMIFLMFVAYFLFGGSPRAGLRMYSLFLVGVGLALGAAALAPILGASLGQFALPAIVFVIAAGLTFLEAAKPLDAIPAYYLGMVAAFAGGVQPRAHSLVGLLVPTAFGLVLAWFTAAVRSNVSRRIGPRSSESDTAGALPAGPDVALPG